MTGRTYSVSYVRWIGFWKECHRISNLLWCHQSQAAGSWSKCPVFVNIGEKVAKPSGSAVSRSVSRGLVTRFEDPSKLDTKPLIFDCAPYNRKNCALDGQSVDLLMNFKYLKKLWCCVCGRVKHEKISFIKRVDKVCQAIDLSITHFVRQMRKSDRDYAAQSVSLGGWFIRPFFRSASLWVIA